MKILGVHGIGHYPRYAELGDADEAGRQLAAEWQEAMGRPGDEVRVAYYSHLLHRGTPQGDEAEWLEPGEQELVIAFVDSLQESPAVAQGPLTFLTRQYLDWMTQRYGVAARAWACALAREVHTYLSAPDSPLRVAARTRVAEAVREFAPDVVVAHSLGSVVAYEALWSDPSLEVGKLITLGSPLALRSVVTDRLVPSKRERPPGVGYWANVADVGDLVAIPRFGVRDSFGGLDQDEEVRIGRFDFHTATAYLRTSEVAGILG